jgi:raffinose/stachyose/melibiose transport system permease protein
MKRGKALLFEIIKYASLLLGVFVALLPLVVVLFASLKTHAELKDPLLPPVNWLNFENFRRAIIEGKMLNGLLNTSIILVVSIAGALFIGTMAAYVLNRFTFRLKGLVLSLFLFATLIPSITQQVAIFKIVQGLGLFNTRAAAVILYMGTDIISIYIFLQFLSTISFSLDESAMLDGASYFTIYRKIILPLMKPAIVTVIILKGIGIYNDFYTPFLYMPDQRLQVISTSLFKFKGPYGSAYEVICAGVVFAMLPSLIVFLSLQKYLYNGFAQGAIKG